MQAPESRMTDNDRRKRAEGFAFLVFFCLTIPAANWMIGHVGTVCVADGPCVVPVGAALVLRDLVQRRLGAAYGLIAIAVGALISWALAPAALVVASTIAFLLSEFADFAVYTPLARRRLVLAVLASSVAGLVVDSFVFLWLAFGSLEFLEGQILGKLWMVLIAMPLIAYLRRRDERLGLTPA